MRQIKEIIIHCSASDNSNHDSPEVIRQWHIARGWTDIGYHYVITNNGSVFEARPVERVGAHCRGRNEHSVGVCLTGDLIFSSDQFKSLGFLIVELCSKYNLSLDDVRLHNEYNKEKSCPNFTLEQAHITGDYLAFQ